MSGGGGGGWSVHLLELRLHLLPPRLQKVDQRRRVARRVRRERLYAYHIRRVHPLPNLAEIYRRDISPRLRACSSGFAGRSIAFTHSVNPYESGTMVAMTRGSFAKLSTNLRIVGNGGCVLISSAAHSVS